MSIDCEKCGGNWGLCFGCPPPKVKKVRNKPKKSALEKRIAAAEKASKFLLACLEKLNADHSDMSLRITHLEESVIDLERK